MIPFRRRARAVLLLATVPLSVLTAAGSVGAHGPDPVFSGPLYAQNQELRFRWKAGQVPPAAMQTAIKAGAVDANESRASKAAFYTYDPAGASWINYGLDVACGVNGLACFSRLGAPDFFTMSFRENGHRYDWGILRWCEMTGRPNGCFDAENSALDEFGHVEILTHHVNFANESDYDDAVVQTFQRVKPEDGYDTHVFGRCDVASLQRKYDVVNTSASYSRCLDIQTSLALATDATWLTYGGSATLSATLSVVDLDEYERLGGNWVSSRTVTIQRRPVGGTTWTTAGTMTPGSLGTYTWKAVSQTASSEWRAMFAKPGDEGLRGDTSGVITISVSSCRTAPCPQSVPAAD